MSDEEEFLRLVEAAEDDAQTDPLPPELKERLEIFAEAYADVEELDHTETVLAILSAWPIYRAWMQEQG